MKLIKLLVVLFLTQMCFSQIVAVVHKDSKNFNTINFDDCRKILLLEKQFWAGGEGIRLVFHNNENTEFKTFVNNVYKFPFKKFKRFYIFKTFKNEINIPIKYYNQKEEMLDFTVNNLNSFIIMNKSELTDNYKIIHQF